MQVWTAASLPASDNLNPQTHTLAVAGDVVVQRGKMIAYYGSLKFEAAATGLLNDKALRQALNTANYGDFFMIAKGTGTLVLGDMGFEISAFNLEDGDLTIKARHLLAFAPGLVCRESAFPGFLNLRGTGRFLASSVGPPQFLETPVRVDPEALLGWADLACPPYHYDFGPAPKGAGGKLMAAAGMLMAGEERQLDFVGNGQVIVHACE